MSQAEKPIKISKQLRLKAQEFLSDRKQSEILLSIVRHFESGADLSVCLLTLDLIFTNLLKDDEMSIEIVPLKPVKPNDENRYKEWLRTIYEGCFSKIIACLEHDSPKIQCQGLSTAMNLVSFEGRHPIDNKASTDPYCVSHHRLRPILIRILSNKQNTAQLINKYTEYLQYDDILLATWKHFPSLTAKCNPNEFYMMNYLLLLEKMDSEPRANPQYLCITSDKDFVFDDHTTKKIINKIWHCVMLWEHTPQTHKQLLIVLLERILTKLEKPILLTDFLMDSLDVRGPVCLLALQGIFTLIQINNLNYPNIYAKLYSMFEPEIFHTKFKARLFYLSDMFLSSTHLPENLVAAFAKRLARLALIAPSEDVVIICMFIANLIIRHPGLKCLLNHPSPDFTNSDPYVMEERDPVKSNAMNSSLWEILSLQHNVLPNVSTAARFISAPLPSVENDLSKVLDSTGDDIFDKELKKHGKLIALAFDKPNGAALSRHEKVLHYWNI